MTTVLVEEQLQTVVVEETATTVIVRAPGPAPAGSGTGTVTSVNASGGTTGLTFSGGPVTSAGTLTLAGTLAVASGGTGGTDAATARGNLSAAASGANSDITALSGITGGIASPDFITLDTGASTTAAVGRIRWDATQGTALLGEVGGNVESHVGQTIDALVHNAEATTLAKGEVVYLFSAAGNKASVKRAQNTGDATSAKTFGVVAESIVAGGTGLVRCVGVLEGLNLGAFSAGDTVYLSASAGQFTATKPVAPNHLVYVGIVERANAGNGRLYVRVQNGYELDELHDVLITSPAAGATIVYDATAGLWKDATITGSGGVSVANGDGSIGISVSGALTASGFTMTTARLLGRTTASSGAVEEITVGSGLTLSGGTLSATGGGSGTVTSVAFSTGTTGLTVTGSPITNSGTITLAGTLAVANGGTGITSFGTGVATALGANVTGSGGIVLATSPVLTTPNLGTPSAATLTNATGLPIGGGTTGTLAVNRGGTGATDAGTARSNLAAAGSGAIGSSGLTMATARILGRTTASTGAVEEISIGSGLTLSSGQLTATGGGTGTVTSVDVSGGTTGLTTSGGPITSSGTITIAGTLAVANGGTGATDAGTARTNLSAQKTITSGTAAPSGGVDGDIYLQYT